MCQKFPTQYKRLRFTRLTMLTTESLAKRHLYSFLMKPSELIPVGAIVSWHTLFCWHSKFIQAKLSTVASVILYCRFEYLKLFFKA